MCSMSASFGVREWSGKDSQYLVKMTPTKGWGGPRIVCAIRKASSCLWHHHHHHHFFPLTTSDAHICVYRMARFAWWPIVLATAQCQAGARAAPTLAVKAKRMQLRALHPCACLPALTTAAGRETARSRRAEKRWVSCVCGHRSGTMCNPLTSHAFLSQWSPLAAVSALSCCSLG